MVIVLLLGAARSSVPVKARGTLGNVNTRSGPAIVGTAALAGKIVITRVAIRAPTTAAAPTASFERERDETEDRASTNLGVRSDRREKVP